MDEIEFKDYIETYLNKIAKKSGVSDLDKYYTSSDLKIDEIKSLRSGSIEQVYAQFIFHAQNATIINNVVKFLKNFNAIKKVTCDFNPKNFFQNMGIKMKVIELSLLRK